MQIHIETASPNPRAVVRFLNGLLLLRYGLAATEDASGGASLADVYVQRSLRLYSSEAVFLLNLLGALVLPATNATGPFPGAAGDVPLRDDRSLLEQPPFAAFPLEGFALETLLQEPMDEGGFEIVSLERGSIDLIIEVGLDRLIERLKKLLGQALDVARSGTPADRQTQRRALRQEVQAAIAEAPFSLQPGGSTLAGVLLIGAEATQGAFADLGAASLTIT